MVDIEKLSSLTEEKQDSNGINVMDAIKGVTSLIKEAKGLQKEFTPQQPQTQQIPQVQAVQPKPIVQQAKPKQPAQPTQAQPKEQINGNSDIEGMFEKVLQALDMGSLIYGDIPISEFKAKVEEDKPKILTMIKGLM